MSLRRREAFVALAASQGLVILEDDFGGSLRYEGSELPPLKALDGSGSVVYLSTFGKKLFPGLRIGWLAAPGPLAERLTRLKAIADYSTSLLLQATAHEFCAAGDLDRHLARVVPQYRERRDAMMHSMREHFPPEVSWTRPDGGLVVWVTLPAGVSASDVASRAEKRSVLVGRGDLFHLGRRSRENLRLSFSQEPPQRISTGVRILGEVIKERIEARPSTRPGSENPLPLI
jgi:2-aminoadipate transaminase